MIFRNIKSTNALRNVGILIDFSLLECKDDCQLRRFSPNAMVHKYVVTFYLFLNFQLIISFINCLLISINIINNRMTVLTVVRSRVQYLYFKSLIFLQANWQLIDTSLATRKGVNSWSKCNNK